MAVNIYLKEPTKVMLTIGGSLQTVSRAVRRAKWLRRRLHLVGFQGNEIEMDPHAVALLVEVADDEVQKQIDQQKKIETEQAGQASNMRGSRVVMPGMRFPSGRN